MEKLGSAGGWFCATSVIVVTEDAILTLAGQDETPVRWKIAASYAVARVQTRESVEAGEERVRMLWRMLAALG